MGGAGTQDRAGVWITIYILVIFVFGAYRRGWLSCDDVLSEDGIARKLMDICTICCIYIRASLSLQLHIERVLRVKQIPL